MTRSGKVIFRWRGEDGIYYETDKKDDWSSSDSPTPGQPNPMFVEQRDLLFTEVGVWQDTSSPTQDFVEIYNQDYRTVDISGYVVSDLDGTDTNTLSQSAALLSPGDFAVVYFDTNGVTESTSEPDGVLDVYYVRNTLRPSSTDSIVLIDPQSRTIDAVSWYPDNSSTPSSFEINDLADICPEYWYYTPDPTNGEMYKVYSVLASPDAGTNTPSDSEGISRYLFEGVPGEFFDSNKKGDWYPAPITPGAPGDESIPEPTGLFLLFVFLLMISGRSDTNL